MRIAVVFDKWKLPIFQRHLEAAGVTFDSLSGTPVGTLGFCVTSDDSAAVAKIIRAANTEAATTKRGSPDAN